MYHVPIPSVADGGRFMEGKGVYDITVSSKLMQKQNMRVTVKAPAVPEQPGTAKKLNKR